MGRPYEWFDLVFSVNSQTHTQIEELQQSGWELFQVYVLFDRLHGLFRRKVSP